MSEWIPHLVTLAVGLFGGGAFWAYWKDRKKSKAAGTVATATVELQIDATRMQNLETRFALAQKAWDEERASFQRRIEYLEKELVEERLELEKKEAKILELERRVSLIQGELTTVSQELAHLRNAKDK